MSRNEYLSKRIISTTFTVLKGMIKSVVTIFFTKGKKKERLKRVNILLCMHYAIGIFH